MLLLLRRQSTFVTDTNHVPRDMINVDCKGRYHTRRSGDGGASGAAIHTASGTRLSIATVLQHATASQTTLPSQERSRKSAISPTNCALCVICQRNTSKQKRSQFRLSECQLDSGASRLQKAAEIIHDQRIKLGLREEDLFAKEVKYHKTCYKRFTRCVDQVKLDKETEQDDIDGADSADDNDDDVDEQQWEKLVDFIRVNILETRQVYKSKDLVKRHGVHNWWK